MKEVDCYKYLEISQMDKTLNDKLIQGVYFAGKDALSVQVE